MSVGDAQKRIFAVGGLVLGWLFAATGFLVTIILSVMLVGFPLYVFLRFSGFFEWKAPLGNWEILVMAFAITFNLEILLGI